MALLSEAGENQIQTHVEDLNLFEILQPVLSHIHLLWELVILSEPIVVMASSPIQCSSMVLALTRSVINRIYINHKWYNFNVCDLHRIYCNLNLLT